jgi:aspartyl-tRNA(Asn)/glutamyl-tRNA(Gln) amidotransferase subunit A
MLSEKLSRRSLLATAALAPLRAHSAKTDLAYLTIAEASAALRSRRISPVELTQACLERVERYQPSINAFITVRKDAALAEARAAEAEIRAGKWRGPFHGVPIALKDNIDTAGIRTTAASNVFKDRVPTDDAEVARRLKQSGAILLGKLNLHEFAYGGTSAVSAFGPVRNPWNPALTPGGSSGGPGAAVAAGLCFAALGTDTAGSVRIPASYCGIVGLKPTYGRVSLRGVIPLSWTLDHVGPMTRTVEDAALLLDVIAGYDAADITTVNLPVPSYVRTLRQPVSKLRIGLPRVPFFDAMHPEVATAIDAALAVLRKWTGSMKDVEVPQVSAGPVLGAEAFAYHAPYFTKTPDLYQPGTRAALERASQTKAEAYVNSLREIARARRDVGKLFSNIDVLVLPTMADPPFRVEEGLARNVSARNTSIFDLYGIPMISIPCGFTSAGLPVGLQIGAAPWAESTVLALAHAYERKTEWHTRRVPEVMK